MQVSVQLVIQILLFALTIAGVVYKFGRTGQKIEDTVQKLDKVEADMSNRIKELSEKNSEQHQELYTSRNDMSNLLTRLATVTENMERRQESMESKIDILLSMRRKEDK